MSAVDEARGPDRREVREEPKLSKRALGNLTAVVSEIRAAVNSLGPIGSPVLDILDASEAIPAVRDLYYELNAEDPDDVMPTRKVIGDWEVARSCVIPILRAVHADARAAEDKRWASSLYHLLRLLSILSRPIDPSNQTLRPGCMIDVHLMDLKHMFATDKSAIQPLVSLLQFYLEKKAEKMAALAAAEDSKLEDARIDNILCFFRNLLTAPRQAVDKELHSRDRGTHLALVGAMARSDLFATTSILFASRDDALLQYTNIVYVTSEIYSLAFRHSSPSELAKSAFRISKASRCAGAQVIEQPNDMNQAADEAKIARHVENRTSSGQKISSSGLREALLRERSTLGGARSILKSARWTSRYSGEFLTTTKQTALVGNKRMWHATKGGEERISSVLNMSSTKHGPETILSLNLQANSEILGLLGASGRAKIVVPTRKTTLCHTVRVDLQEQGKVELGKLALALINESFAHLISELRERITEFRVRNNVDETWRGRRHFMLLVSAGLGFQRELAVLRSNASGEPVSTERSISHTSMEKALRIRKDLAVDWKPVEASIDPSSIKLVFDGLIEAREDRDRIAELEMASSAVREMLNFLQCMIMCDQASPGLTSRELALNTLEEVFENEAYLEVPSLLAKEFDPKCHSFDHLANAIEIAFTFTAALMDNELKHITVMRQRRKRAKRAAKKKESKPNEGADNSEGLIADQGLEDLERSASDVEECSNDEGGCLQPEVSSTPDAADQGTDTKVDELVVGEVDGDDVQLSPRDSGDDKPCSSGILDAGDSSSISPHSVGMPKDVGSEPDDVVGETTGCRKDSCENDEHSPEVNGPVETSESRKVSTNAETDDNIKLSDDGGTASKPSISTKGGDGSSGKKGESDDEDELETAETEGDDPGALEEAVCEVESADVIRRFARPKALQHIMLAIRGAICMEEFLPVPEGSRNLSSLSLVARSVAVLNSIWQVTGSIERGAFRCAFYNLATLHLCGLAISLSENRKCLDGSILHDFASLSREISDGFHSMLAFNPALLVDALFFPDLSTQRLYASKQYQKEMMESGD